VLAPIGLILLIALTIAQLAIGDKNPWWAWVGALVLYLAAAFGYLGVVVGPSALLK
jgi:hypothetical protein